MTSLLDRAWRVPATGFAFLCVFFGGGVLALALWPVLVVYPGDRRGLTQRTIRRLFHTYLLGLRLGGLLRIEVVEAARLQQVRGVMVVANHPSLLDVVILMSLIPRAQCIVKHELWQHRFLGPLMRQAGYLSNALPAEEMVAACAASLEAGENLIIFPEGTRSRPGQPLVMQRGFAHLATLSNATIVPVTITCDPPTLVKGEPWWRIPTRPPLFRLVVGERIESAAFLRERSRGLAARDLVKYLREYFESRLTDVRN